MSNDLESRAKTGGWCRHRLLSGGAGKLACVTIFAVLALLALLNIAGTQADDGGVLLDRQQAIEIAVNIISPATIDRNVTAFMPMAPLQPGDVIHPFMEEERARTITAPTWFCWIDDDSQSFFGHDTRYVFIDATTGAVEVVVEKWWPELNGQSLFMSDAEWDDLQLVIYSSIHLIEIEEDDEDGGGQ